LVDDAPDAAGQYGGALLFVRWTADGERPDGHVESDYLFRSESPGQTTAFLRALTLYQVKEELDRAIDKPSSTGW